MKRLATRKVQFRNLFFVACLALTAVTEARGECSSGQCQGSSFAPAFSEVAPSGNGQGAFRSPFSVPTASSSSGFIPIENSANRRTIAINGIAVPKAAIGWRIVNGQIEWVMGGTPISSNSQNSPTPSLGNAHEGSSGSGELIRPGRPTLPPGSQTNPQAPQANSSGLVPANTKQNPGFAFAVLGRGFSENCQATLISDSSGMCIAATAAHCLSEGVKRSPGGIITQKDLSPDYCGANLRNRGVNWGQAQIEMADFGRVTAHLYINPERTEDSAVFAFSCPKGAGNVKVLPLAKKPLANEEDVFYGKVMGGKAGLYGGKVWREPGIVGINSRAIGEAQESILQPSDVAIEQGDSGGGVYRNGDKELELAGVLSTSDDIRRRLPLGNYATNRSLEFIKCMKTMISGSNENGAALPSPNTSSVPRPKRTEVPTPTLRPSPRPTLTPPIEKPSRPTLPPTLPSPDRATNQQPTEPGTHNTLPGSAPRSDEFRPVVPPSRQPIPQPDIQTNDEEGPLFSTQGHGLADPEPKPSGGLELAKTRYEKAAKQKTLLLNLEESNKSRDSVTINDTKYKFQILHQACIFDGPGTALFPMTVSLLTDENSDPIRNYIQIQNAQRTDDEVKASMRDTASKKGLLQDSNDDTTAINYTERVTEAALLSKGYTHKQISLVSDGKGGYFTKYVLKSGANKTQPGFKDNPAKDKIYYCLNEKLWGDQTTDRPTGPEPKPLPVPTPTKRELESEIPIAPIGSKAALVQQGANIYTNKCLGCHASGNMAEKLKNLEKVKEAIGLVEGIEAIMPKNDLGPVKELSPNEKIALISFLESPRRPLGGNK